MRSFEYFRPSSLETACRLLGGPDNGAKVLAGGTDLLVQIKQDKIRPKSIVSLRDVPDLSFIRSLPEGGLEIGAMTRLRTIETSPVIPGDYGAVAEAAGRIGSVQVRTRATLGGNVCNAAPSADMAPILMAYGARAVIADGHRERSIPLEDFFKGPGRTDLREGELLTKIFLPVPRQPSFATYLKACRSEMDIALVGVALQIVFDPERGTCHDMRLALGAIAPTPVLMREPGTIAAGSGLDDRLIAEVVRLAVEATRPISDVRATADYRRTLVEVLTKRALVAARAWIQNGADQ